MAQITTISNKNDPSFLVPNIFFKQEKETNHLALILPGLNYTCDMPLLYYSTQVMLGAGADVVQVKYDYTEKTMEKSVTLPEKVALLQKDVTKITSVALEQSKYQRLTVIGKSLGTLCISCLLEAAFPVKPQICIFLTPILQQMLVAFEMIKSCPNTFYVIGTTDPYYDPELIVKFRSKQPDNFLIIEGVNHSLELPGDTIHSLSVLDNIVRRLNMFIKEEVR